MKTLSEATISLVFAALFAIAFITFVTNFAWNNDAAIDISDDSEFSGLSDTLEGDLVNFNTQANASQGAFFSTESEAGDQQSKSGGQFKQGISGTMAASQNILKAGWNRIFGADTGFGLFISVGVSLLVFILGLLAYKAWFGRSPA